MSAASSIASWFRPRQKAITAFATPWATFGLAALAHKIGLANIDIPANTTALLSIFTTGSVYAVPNVPGA